MTIDECQFVEQAVMQGWGKKLVEDVLKLCDGFNNFIKIADDVDLEVFINSLAGRPNLEEDEPDCNSSHSILAHSKFTDDITVDRTVVFYENHYKDIAKGLFDNAKINNYDHVQEAQHLAHYLPDEFLFRLWDGYGHELLDNNFDSELSSQDLCHHIVLYVIYKLIYELSRQRERLGAERLLELDISEVTSVNCHNAQVHVVNNHKEKGVGFFSEEEELEKICQSYDIRMAIEDSDAERRIYAIQLKKKSDSDFYPVKISGKRIAGLYARGCSFLEAEISAEPKGSKEVFIDLMDDTIAEVIVNADELQLHMSERSKASIRGVVETAEVIMDDKSLLMATGLKVNVSFLVDGLENSTVFANSDKLFSVRHTMHSDYSEINNTIIDFENF